MQSNYKKCPQCGQPAVLAMQFCQRCGHQYQTAPSPHPSQMWVIPVLLSIIIGVMLAMLGAEKNHSAKQDKEISDLKAQVNSLDENRNIVHYTGDEPVKVMVNPPEMEQFMKDHPSTLRNPEGHATILRAILTGRHPITFRTDKPSKQAY